MWNPSINNVESFLSFLNLYLTDMISRDFVFPKSRLSISLTKIQIKLDKLEDLVVNNSLFIVNFDTQTFGATILAQ